VKGLFVTGTDTGVGKTLAAAALLHALRRHHARVLGMKPVAAGAMRVGSGWASEDALALRAASSIAVPPELDNPVLLPEPMSPHLAAQRAGVRIDIDGIVRCYRQLAQRADFVVVEGAGGFLVPLGEHQTGADLARALRAADGPEAQAEVGIEHARALGREVLDGGAPGLHLYTFNQHEAVIAVLERLGLVFARRESA